MSRRVRLTGAELAKLLGKTKNMGARDLRKLQEDFPEHIEVDRRGRLTLVIDAPDEPVGETRFQRSVHTIWRELKMLRKRLEKLEARAA
jgi:hypothetical protein